MMCITTETPPALPAAAAFASATTQVRSGTMTKLPACITGPVLIENQKKTKKKKTSDGPQGVGNRKEQFQGMYCSRRKASLFHKCVCAASVFTHANPVTQMFKVA